jgi:hypothetical protein
MLAANAKLGAFPDEPETPSAVRFSSKENRDAKGEET